MVDAVQWHLEDIIRDPMIDPVAALELKRRIDRSNQVRTDMVEQLDTYFLDRYKDVNVLPDATINTESPAWALDRLSILALKIYHMEAEVNRTDASPEHLANARPSSPCSANSASTCSPPSHSCLTTLRPAANT